MAKKASFRSHLDSDEVDRCREILESIPTLEAAACLGTLAMKAKEKEKPSAMSWRHGERRT